jgi:dCTP deaminase
MESYNSIKQLCEQGVVEGYKPSAINATSLDIHLGNKILVERFTDSQQVVDYRAREKLQMKELTLDPEIGYVLRPGEFILAASVETFNFPNTVGALLRCKSSMGRIGLEHLDAGWVDPGFHGVLTLEYVNVTQFHSIRIRPGDAIGQLIFMSCEEVPMGQSYKTKGNYNGKTQAAQAGFRQL